jgi:1-acyl-sn-glycerol-3-phosphate acyltransferase
VGTLVAEMHPGTRAAAARLDSRLDQDLGIDSLARVELGLRMEKAFGRRLPDKALAEAETVSDLLAALVGAADAALHVRLLAEPLPVSEARGEPDEATTLLEVLDWHVARHGDRRSVTFLASDDEIQTCSYAELDTRARRVAAGLHASGLLRQQACALMLPTSLDFFAVYCGILMAGGIPVPIYPPFRMSQIEDHLKRQAGILANCEAAILVTVPEATLVAGFLKGDVPTLHRVTTPGELEAADGALEPVPVHAGDVAFIQYTSGSTGNPKGVVLTHANLLANIRAMGHAAQAGPRDVFVSWLPLYHDMGLIGAWLGTLYFAVHLVLMSPVSFLGRPARWLWAIHRTRATISAAPNFAYEICASRLDEQELQGLDLSSVRWAFNGAEPVSADTMTRFATRFAPFGFDPRALAPVYGLAESALDITFPPPRRGVLVDYIDREALVHAGRAVPIAPGDPHALKLVACGRALPGHAVRIADRKGRELPERTEGRIEFRGPSATSGYYRNPEATASLFDGDWLDTGDLGYLAAGELYVTGRAKDMIIRGGHNVYPYELEDAVGSLPGVRKGCVAVFGARDATAATERIVVLAETRETDPGARDRLRGEINQLAVALIGGPPDDIVLGPPHAVLKTSSGKIRRAATRDAYERGLLGATRHAVWLQLARLAMRGARGRARRALSRAASYAYGAWAWSMFGLVGAIGSAGAFAIPGVRARRATARALARLLASVTRVRIEVEGLEQLPRDQPYVLVANHASYIDGLVLTAAIPGGVVFVAKAELREHWLTRRILGAIGTRFVERFEAARGIEDTRALLEVARAGESLGFFAEGTFVREPGLQPFRMGAFVVAARDGVPIVPVALAGTRAILPAGTWLPRPGRVRVVIGAPVRPRGIGWAAALELRAAARAEILARCGEPDVMRTPMAAST